MARSRRSGVFPLLAAAFEAISDAARSLAGGDVPRSRLLGFDAGVFSRQLASLLRSGVPLPQALAFLRDEFATRIGKRLDDVRERVAAGDPLSAALAELPADWFPPPWRATVAAGERCGQLAAVLDQIADEAERLVQIGRRLQGVLVYSFTVLLFASLITAMVLAKVIPTFAAVFAGLGQALPLPTRIVIGVSVYYPLWFLLLLIGIALIGGVSAPATGSFWRAAGQRLANLTPFVSGILRTLVEVRFTRTLRLLLDAGVPLPEALDLCEDTVADSRAGRQIAAAARRIREGVLPSEALAEVGAIAPAFLWFLGGSEHRGDFLAVTTAMAESADARLTVRLELAERYLEPAAILITGAIVGFIVISFYLPLFRLIPLLT